jgi:hypothetical protein
MQDVAAIPSLVLPRITLKSLARKVRWIIYWQAKFATVILCFSILCPAIQSAEVDRDCKQQKPWKSDSNGHYPFLFAQNRDAPIEHEAFLREHAGDASPDVHNTRAGSGCEYGSARKVDMMVQACS